MAWSWGGAATGALAGSSLGIYGALGGGLLGGFTGGGDERSANTAREINEQQIALSREQMAFQERMSSTAHQREVKDLIAAGLNPILSATGGSGASSPGGSMPVLVNPDKNLSQDRALMGNLMATTAKVVSETAKNRTEMKLNEEAANTQKTQQLLNVANAKAASGFVGVPGFFRAPLSSAASAVKSVVGSNSARQVALKKQGVKTWFN